MAYRSCASVLCRPLGYCGSIRSRSTVASGALKSLKDMPGPRGWPVIGCLPEFAADYRAGDSQDQNFSYRNHLKFGPIYKIKLFNTLLVAVCEPEVAPLLVRAEGAFPSRMGEFTDNNMAWVYKKNKMAETMALSAGPEWKKIRSAAAKQIIPRRVANFTAPVNDLSREFADHLESISRAGNGTISDITEPVMKVVFQVMAYFVLGEKLNVYEEGNQDYKELQEAIQAIADSFFKMVFALPLYKLFPTRPYREHVDAVQRLLKSGRHILHAKYNDVKAAIERGVVDETKAVGFMEQWLIEGKFDEEEAIMLSSQTLVGGTENTTWTAIFMLHELAKNPEVQESVCEEFRSVMGERTAPTFEDFQKMPLIRGCVKEALRLYPTVDNHSRIVQEPIEILGYHIPAKTQVMYNFVFAGRNPDYVKDPLSFKPERWSRDRKPRLDPFVSLPFGTGPRNCWGRRIAELMLYSMLGQVIPRFQLTTTQTSVKTKIRGTLRPNEAVSIHFSPR